MVIVPVKSDAFEAGQPTVHHSTRLRPWIPPTLRPAPCYTCRRMASAHDPPTVAQRDRAPDFSADDPVAEAGRQIMDRLLDLVLAHHADLASTTSEVAVHETRKAIRQLRTALRVFEPYFRGRRLWRTRRRFRRFMRRLAESRDAAVFLERLERFMAEGAAAATLNAEEERGLIDLRDEWRSRHEEADRRIRDLLEQGKAHRMLARFGRFTGTPGLGVAEAPAPWTPATARLVAPVLIYQKVAAVRAFSGRLQVATLPELHALRIRCKELRYTLEFFEPILGPETGAALPTLRGLLEHLGDINDARAAVEQLDALAASQATPGAALFRRVREDDLRDLLAGLPAAWEKIEDPAWRRQLALAFAVL
jgi:CHAD domain-containing protein